MKKQIPTFVQYIIGAVALLSAGFGFWSSLDSQINFKVTKIPMPPLIDPFTKVAVEAKAAFVYEPDTGRVLYAKDEHARLPIASITKVMTVLAASQLLPKSTILPFSRQHYRLKDLMALTLVTSSNQGALSLATMTQTTVGRDLVTAMNDKAVSLKLAETTFNNTTGLDLPDGQAGSYSSAYDVAHLFTNILATDPELLAATKFEEIEASTVEGVRHRFLNTNEIISQLPGLLGSKTGFTDVAEGTLVIAFDRGLNQPVIIVVLGSTIAGRFNDVKQLVDATIATFLQQS